MTFLYRSLLNPVRIKRRERNTQIVDILARLVRFGFECHKSGIQPLRLRPQRRHERILFGSDRHPSSGRLSMAPLSGSQREQGKRFAGAGVSNAPQHAPMVSDLSPEEWVA